ncbi:3-deoxy-manno-octulosonate cytidylyltransferase [Desulfurella amilsii]|uniref:3-deoxy-manno-octulosonate cytidylyltransferase n=1 Tax=Desulfurella amilsii TaxID=1562698 RepID=A0A1X4XZE6_9BACT|nr:3-deoxy-manno-octulosonate cytidylyltransferase [Desulfurella amilsii]OSS42919.1 3-deoxy-manno-octulosonate cytidylyltransferase [Desulfurella amilsii]
MNIAVLIPARLGSTRFPKKLLAKVKDKTIIEWTYLGVKNSKLANFNAVLTDSLEIKETIENIGGNAYLVEGTFSSGTDRIAHFIADKDYDIIVNVQGDEPLIDANMIDELINFFTEKKLQMATLAVKCNECADNVNDVKVVIDKNNFALYFSRSKIPYNANFYDNYLKHIGIYVYDKDTLLFLHNQKPTALELAEKLEQLRALDHSIKIGVLTSSGHFIGIDTKEDLQLFEQYVNSTKP